MSGDGMIPSSRPVTDAPPPLSGCTFYEDVARRLERTLPEHNLSPTILAVIDQAFHRERQAWRHRFDSGDSRDGAS